MQHIDIIGDTFLLNRAVLLSDRQVIQDLRVVIVITRNACMSHLFSEPINQKDEFELTANAKTC